AGVGHGRAFSCEREASFRIQWMGGAREGRLDGAASPRDHRARTRAPGRRHREPVAGSWLRIGMGDAAGRADGGSARDRGRVGSFRRHDPRGAGACRCAAERAICLRAGGTDSLVERLLHPRAQRRELLLLQRPARRARRAAAGFGAGRQTCAADVPLFGKPQRRAVGQPTGGAGAGALARGVRGIARRSRLGRRPRRALHPRPERSHSRRARLRLPRPRDETMKPTLIAIAAAIALFAAACAKRATVAPPAPPPAAAAAAPAPAAAPGGGATEPDPDAAKMPDGAGKQEVTTLCTGCHSLARIVSRHQTRAQWQDTLSSMQDNGLSATEAQLAAVLDYLTKNYGPAKPGTAPPAW